MAALFLVWGAWRGGGRTSGADAAQLKTIAVLPFTSGGDTASDYFAEGISEELHGELVRVEGLTVKARSVARLFKDREDDLAAVAAPLGIGSLVVGSVRRAGSRVRITAELLRVANNSTVWSQKFDGEERDLFALQDSVARSIATSLQTRLVDANSPHGGPAGTTSLAAYDLYLRGRSQLDKGGEQSTRRAIVLFQHAIDADPSFARAYADLGRALWTLPYAAAVSHDSVHASALAAVEKALALDSELATAHAARGSMLVYDWPYRWEAAENSLRRAIVLDPRLATAHVALGGYLFDVGRIEESIAEHQRATELDPYHWVAWANLGISQMAARQYDAAIASYRHGLQLVANLDEVHEALAIAFVLQGKPDLALRELTSRTDSGLRPVELASRAFVYAKAGQPARAQSMARQLEKIARTSVDLMGPLAYAFLGLGDSTRALDWLIRAADAHVRPMRALWADIPSPELDPIRSLPRYPELLRKLNLQDQPVAKLKPGGR
jgi:TolB-like protein/Tfp pilus assembly protein PilF